MTRSTLPDFEDDGVCAAIEGWFTGLSRQERAELRRCDAPVEAGFLPAFSRLRFARTAEGVQPFASRQLADPVAVTAILLARLREAAGDLDRGATLGALMGKPPQGTTVPPVSDARFRRLVDVDASDAGEVLRTLRRLVDLLGPRQVPVAPLAATAFRLCHPFTAEREKWNLALAYYETRDQQGATPRPDDQAA